MPGRGQAASAAVREAVRVNLELPDTIIEAIAQRAAAIVLEQNGNSHSLTRTPAGTRREARQPPSIASTLQSRTSSFSTRRLIHATASEAGNACLE
jgi:hypothetical protein